MYWIFGWWTFPLRLWLLLSLKGACGENDNLPNLSPKLGTFCFLFYILVKNTQHFLFPLDEHMYHACGTISPNLWTFTSVFILFTFVFRFEHWWGHIWTFLNLLQRNHINEAFYWTMSFWILLRCRCEITCDYLFLIHSEENKDYLFEHIPYRSLLNIKYTRNFFKKY